MRAETVRQALDPGDAFVAALGDDVGGPEDAGRLLPVGVPAHGDDDSSSHRYLT
ncbi:hypothetical protein [Paractinoplanes abujensis]|uniref:Uncharacterized protein n=1 Tax=Paractinoplanes abujensis TaxID=882441 RepID=A0A7W7CQT7_9ACTN|nr:hypothetical protein [Actinoplanes abujensis]MBB4693017.1 hypothetical protein [Actinoplanes abujensis]